VTLNDLEQHNGPYFALFHRIRVRCRRKTIVAALWNRAGHHIFALWFLSFFLLFLLLFSSPNLSGRTVDVYNTSTNGVALVRI